MSVSKSAATLSSLIESLVHVGKPAITSKDKPEACLFRWVRLHGVFRWDSEWLILVIARTEMVAVKS